MMGDQGAADEDRGLPKEVLDRVIPFINHCVDMTRLHGHYVSDRMGLCIQRREKEVIENIWNCIRGELETLTQAAIQRIGEGVNENAFVITLSYSEDPWDDEIYRPKMRYINLIMKFAGGKNCVVQWVFEEQ